MKISEFFSYCIKCGIDADPRGQEEPLDELKKRAEEFKKKPPSEKKYFDKSRLTNPYADSRILNNSSDNFVKKILCGIDIDVGELLLADTLNRSGAKIDLVVSHHPVGYAYGSFYEVMGMQARIQAGWGVPINIAEELLEERMDIVERSVMPRNHTQVSDAAAILGIPLLNVHTPADNHVASFLGSMFKDKNNLKLKDVIEKLNAVEEYDLARRKFLPGPKIVSGKPERSAGRIVVDMTGGTEGAVDAVCKLALAGCGTIVGMHFSEKHIKKARENHINMVIAGHIPSDNLGLNLLFDKVEKKYGRIQFVECSGFRRIPRNRSLSKKPGKKT
ncbi:MAG: NGG1p interacting factor NIF3 [Elusimicrobia bacterium CG08_land_8_20_14_0_20_44_26]|nr:MAG: NGG1p interacting factor NIF3 [Elusimicrobia bacterium CG08_land_8_20_14_0_20_44_26]